VNEIYHIENGSVQRQLDLLMATIIFADWSRRS